MKKRTFSPNEIIFCPTAKCNLNCSHCWTKKSNDCLDIEDTKKFLLSCKNATNDSGECPIEKIGFSGGEPFLNLDFVETLSNFAVENDFYFDQIITNGVFWQNENELEIAIKRLYDSKFDGKIALSCDSFHASYDKNYYEKINFFINCVNKIFPEQTLLIQAVDYDDFSFLDADIQIPVYKTKQAFLSTDLRAWKSKKWFCDDYCTELGNVLFVHANGNIAPCCGFANENDALIIGSIKQNFCDVIQQAKNNKMVKLCFEEGLLNYAKKIKNKTGKTDEQCTFCDFICHHFV